MSRFAAFGNDLYSGKRSIDFVGRQRLWYAISGAGSTSGSSSGEARSSGCPA